MIVFLKRAATNWNFCLAKSRLPGPGLLLSPVVASALLKNVRYYVQPSANMEKMETFTLSTLVDIWGFGSVPPFPSAQPLSQARTALLDLFLRSADIRRLIRPVRIRLCVAGLLFLPMIMKHFAFFRGFEFVVEIYDLREIRTRRCRNRRTSAARRFEKMSFIYLRGLEFVNKKLLLPSDRSRCCVQLLL